MVTGYEAGMYRDFGHMASELALLRHQLERVADALEAMNERQRKAAADENNRFINRKE